MANERFDPQMSSDKIWHGDQQERCITDDLETLEQNVTALQTGKAPTNHNHDDDYAPITHSHTGYAQETHGHSQADITGLESALAGKAPTSHTHDYASSTHGHTQAEITGLLAALEGKAAATHDHTLSQIVGLLAALAAKADLVDGKVPESQLPGYVDDVLEYASLSGFPTAGESGKIYVATDTNKTYRWSGTTYVEISGSIALGETSGTAYRGDRGKTAYDHSQDGTVHVTADQKTAWDGKAAGNHTHTPASIGAAAASHSHSYNALTDKPTIPTEYTHPASHPASMITGLATVATSGKYTDLTDKPTIPTIPSSLPANGGNADTVDDKHASDFATASHNHNSSYVSKSIQITADDGDVKVSWSNQDVVAKIKALGTGMHTAYAKGGSTNNPKTTESWRFLVHKTGVNYGWVMAFGAQGSVYCGYLDNGTWKGWKCIYDAANTILWSGASYLNSNNGTPQTVTPSKKLSECAHGWMLLWSDYDPGEGANDIDFCTTFIPKKTPSGGTWGGKAFLCDLPAYVGSDPDNTATEKRVIKPVYVHDDKLVGSYQNTSGGRNDVVLRAVYEF